jgi:hypothetical protein
VDGWGTLACGHSLTSRRRLMIIFSFVFVKSDDCDSWFSKRWAVVAKRLVCILVLIFEIRCVARGFQAKNLFCSTDVCLGADRRGG